MFECFKAGEEIMILGQHEPIHLQDRSKDQCENLVEFNLVEERKVSQPIYISASLFSDLKQPLLYL